MITPLRVARPINLQTNLDFLGLLTPSPQPKRNTSSVSFWLRRMSFAGTNDWPSRVCCYRINWSGVRFKFNHGFDQYHSIMNCRCSVLCSQSSIVPRVPYLLNNNKKEIKLGTCMKLRKKKKVVYSRTGHCIKVRDVKEKACLLGQLDGAEHSPIDRWKKISLWWSIDLLTIFY